MKRVLLNLAWLLSSTVCWAQETDELDGIDAAEAAREQDSSADALTADPEAPESDSLAPLDPDSQRPGAVRQVDEPFAPNRWLDVGGFVGSAIRPNGSGPIQYKVGLAYGAYIRPEIKSWLGLTLYYRQESIPVSVEQGGFDYDGVSYSEDWQQPNLELVSLGFRVEPTWVVDPRLRLYGILGLGWARFIAPMPEAVGQDFGRSRRAAVELNYVVGAGAYFDLIPNWVNAGLSVSYGFVGNQSGTAYESLQIIKDGDITELAPLPQTQSVADVLFSLGLIL